MRLMICSWIIVLSWRSNNLLVIDLLVIDSSVLCYCNPVWPTLSAHCSDYKRRVIITAVSELAIENVLVYK